MKWSRSPYRSGPLPRRSRALGSSACLALAWVALTTNATAQDLPAEAEAPAEEGEAPPAAQEDPAPAPEAFVAPEEAAAEEPEPAATPEPEPEPVVEGPTAAEPPSPAPFPVEFSSSTFSRFEYRSGYDRLGVSRARFVEGDMTVYRVRLGVRTRPLEVTDGVVASLQFSPQVSGVYGKTGTVAEQNLGLYEGYLRVAGESLSVDLGRFAMNYGDALVIGNLDWHQTGRAFEGARGRYKFGEGWLDLFVTQTARPPEVNAEGHPVVNSPLFAGDSYFWGLYSAWGKLLRESMDLDVYLLGVTRAKTRGVAVDPEDPAAGTYTQRAATEITIGTRLKDKLGDVVDYRLEAGLQTGARPNPTDGGRTGRSVMAYQVEGELGLRAAEPLRIAFGGAAASGDDPTTTDRDEGWNELYPTAHKFLGLMDVIGARSNVWSAMAKVQGKLSDSLTLNVDGHYFGRFEVPAGTDKQAGTEVDAYLVKKIGGPLAARVLYGIFLPNADHYPSGDAAHYGEAELSFVF